VYFITFLRERAGLVAFVVAVVYFLFLIRSDMVQNSVLKAEKKFLEKSMAQEQLRFDTLKRKMALLNKSSYVELKAREQLGLVVKGESAYKVIFK